METAARLLWVRRTGALVVALTFALMVLGSWVKATGSGLACPDWPQCYGEWLPPFPSAENGGTYQGESVTYGQANILYEWAHRAVASLLGVPFLALVLLTLAGRDLHPALRALPAAAGGVLLVQYGIGGGTVLQGNPAWLTTLHLATATLFLLLVTCAAAFAFLRPLRAEVLGGGRPVVLQRAPRSHRTPQTVYPGEPPAPSPARFPSEPPAPAGEERHG